MVNKSMTSEGYIAPMDKDPGPSAVDRVIQRPVHFGSMSEPALRKAIREVAEDRDSEPSATDRGPGVEFTMRSTGEVIEDHGSGVEYHTIDLSGPATIQLDLPPEVMAQLQRIEDRLLGVEVFLAKIWATVAPAPKNEVIRPPMILGDDDYDDDEL